MNSLDLCMAVPRSFGCGVSLPLAGAEWHRHNVIAEAMFPPAAYSALVMRASGTGAPPRSSAKRSTGW
jgi:hypothetical protein